MTVAINKNDPISVTIQPGIYGNHDISNDAYHADREYVSSSGLKLLPYKVDEFIARYMMTHKLPPKSEALKFGGGLHSAILEPDIFPTEYVIEPEVNKRTNDGKAELAEFYKSVQNNGQTVLTPDDMDLIRAMRSAVFQHPIAGPALKGAAREQSFFINSSEGIKLKVRTDAFKNNVIMDIKSTESMDKFFNYAAQFGYNFSEAMYRSVVSEVINESIEFLFVVIQKGYPFTVAVFQSDELTRSEGLRKYEASKRSYIDLKESNGWGEIRSLSLPNWAKPESEGF